MGAMNFVVVGVKTLESAQVPHTGYMGHGWSSIQLNVHRGLDLLSTSG